MLPDDPADSRLELFPDDDTERTVRVTTGSLAYVSASDYGDPFGLTPEDSPTSAVDGDVFTAWRGAVGADERGLTLHVELVEEVRADHLVLVQPLVESSTRHLTKVRLRLDDREWMEVALDASSRTPTGQRVKIPTDPFRSVTIEAVADNLGVSRYYSGLRGVGLGELIIPGVKVGSVSRMPDLVSKPNGRRLTYLMTRQRIDAAQPYRLQPEQVLARQFLVPEDRGFDVGGTVRLSADATDEVINRLIGDATRPVPVASSRINGVAELGGHAAVDGDLTTAWTTPFDGAVGASLVLDLASDPSGRTLRVDTMLGERLSKIVSLAARGSGDQYVKLVVDPATDIAEATLPAGFGNRIELTIEEVVPVTSTSYFTRRPTTHPAAVAEVTVGGMNPLASAWRWAEPCRRDLINLDGRPMAVRLVGTPEDLLAGRALEIEACEGSVTLRSGEHLLEAASGRMTGIDVDRLVLDAAAVRRVPTSATTADLDDVVERSATHWSATLGAGDESWLVLHESLNKGWRLSVDGVDLGPATLVDGYANGWLVPASTAERTVAVVWTPQKSVNRALWVSLLAGALVLSLAIGLRCRPLPAIDRAPIMRRPGRSRWAVVLAVSWFAMGPPGVAGAATGLMLCRTGRRTMAAALLVLSVGGASAWAMALQWYFRFPPGASWPTLAIGGLWFTWFGIGILLGVVAWPSPPGSDGFRDDLEMAGGDRVPVELACMTEGPIAKPSEP
jgi:hypothetical protein